MTYARRLILALALSAGIAPALAQVPAPVPALPDTERRTAYTISASTCVCNVNFAIYGDGTDYASWLEVFVNGVLIPASGNWTITSPTGSLGSIPRPITDAVLTFTNAQTGTVQIVGARRPRRVSQFNENQGVPARNLNQALTDIIAQNRELWDKTNDITGRGLFSQPGNTIGLLPIPSLCANAFLGFDATGLIPQCLPGGAGSGNMVGPVTATAGHAAVFGATSNLLTDAGGAPALTNNNLSDLINKVTSRANLGVAIGSNVQAWDADLDCIAAISTTGIVKRTGAGTCAAGSAAADLTNGTTGSGAVVLATSAALSPTTVTLANGASNGIFFKASGGSNDAQINEGPGGGLNFILGVANSWSIQTNVGGSLMDYNSTTANTFTMVPNVALAAGLTIGSPTGGNKGAGTINIAGAFYANGVAVTGTGTVTSVICGTGLSGGTITGSGTCAVNLSALTNSLGADVALSNTASYFDGPSVAQGTSGTWWASGTVTLTDTAGAAQFHCRLWDGTTVIDSGGSTNLSAGTPASIGLSGYLATPAANIKISCRDTSTTSGKILFNQTGNSKDSTLSVHRIQ